ncbi:hypothetical protein NQ315_003772 [Exocentrus adspersus]|uniref:Cyclic nucleotide-binding domain-containing protein n=1 Tax=Exocentrus adspersus TaxID=1586481 RepID=A0AAV8VI22_9CUCU|nr:hypothetical protein NQ315_003772 [Exocentrus adspersus]
MGTIPVEIEVSSFTARSALSPLGAHNTITLCTLGVGATFGESILHDLPRDTTVVTQTTCELLRVEQHDFRLIFEVVMRSRGNFQNL